jgi:hypothetical protein
MTLTYLSPAAALAAGDAVEVADEGDTRHRVSRRGG